MLSYELLIQNREGGGRRAADSSNSVRASARSKLFVPFF
jgi:hypothetical protein